MKDINFETEEFSGVLTVGSDEGLYQIEVEGKRFWFEFSRMWGPRVVSKSGHETKQPRPRHNFWKAVSLWANQGKRVCDEGLCRFERNPPLVVRKIGGRNLEILAGEPCDIWPQPFVYVDEPAEI